MKVILTSDIDDIGLTGEVKTVRNGLARNYLIPQKLAIEATDSNLRDWEKKLEKLGKKREKTISDAKEIADKIEATVISIESKISDGQKMFGSVNVQTIADALEEQHGMKVEKKQILLEKNIKSIGRFEVPIRVKANIKASVIVEITAEEDEKKAQVEMEEAEEMRENTWQSAQSEDAGENTETAEAVGTEEENPDNGESETEEKKD